MVKTRNNHNSKTLKNQELNEQAGSATKIGANTQYETCTERITSFGGLLALVKFLDLFKFEEIIENLYIAPSRKPVLGHYKMVYGFLILLFIGFTRVWHFMYIRIDSMVTSILGVEKLSHVTTFWRYLDSLGINQAKSLLLVSAALRERVWAHCGLTYDLIRIDIDTTVETVYGYIEGAFKGHNTKNRGKKGLRPVLAFIAETREYLTGQLRRGKTINSDEVATLIRSFPKYLPGSVLKVLIRSDGEFISWDSVRAAKDNGYHYILGTRNFKPPFDDNQWYTVKKKDFISYNECVYKPHGWEEKDRFVVMRIPKKRDVKTLKNDGTQLELYEDNKYKYRVFATDLKWKPHKVISEYDGRADAENLVGESKREGLSAIPSKKFKNNYAFFQIVMLAYNIWRYMKIVASVSVSSEKESNHEIAKEKNKGVSITTSIKDHTIRIARLILLMIGAKIVSRSNTVKVRYSIHDSRSASLIGFLTYLDYCRKRNIIWFEQIKWKPRCQPPDFSVQNFSCTKKYENNLPDT